jgi:hypothetical protein
MFYSQRMRSNRSPIFYERSETGDVDALDPYKPA